MASRRRGILAEIQHQRKLREQEQRRRLAEEQRFARQVQRENERIERERQKAERASERAEAEATREQQKQYAEGRKAEAAALTRALEARMAELDTALVDGVAAPGPTSLDQFRPRFEPTAFAPPPSLAAVQSPEWDRFAPPPPTGVGRLLRAGHQQAVNEARQRFDLQVAFHEQREQERLVALAQLRQEHQITETARRVEVERHNAELDALATQVAGGVPDAVADFATLLIEATPRPHDLPIEVDVVYQPEPRKLLVVSELPSVQVIPEMRAHTYVRARDEIDAKPRPVKEIHRHYSTLVAQLVLLAMHDAFQVDPAVVGEVAVNGRVSTTNRATGQPERPCLVSVSATREQFASLVLSELDPVECLRHLNALVSPHPWDLEAVRPIFDPDLDKYRRIDAHEVAAGLDSRTVLLDLSPTEFEHLVRELFEAMGMKSWVTQASRDDGVDAIAFNEDPIMGGTCVIQAKRYSRAVPIEAVRALAGTMEEKRASRGVLVTTSWLGAQSHTFAAKHERIQLIEGEHLKHLLAEHLDLDVVVGVRPGRRSRLPS